MTQTQVKVKGRSLAVAPLVEGLPIEIVQLLNVLARIEARRQAKLRASCKEVV